MNWLRELARRLRMLMNHRQFDADLEEEMRLHLEMRQHEHLQSGMEADDARAAARRRFGNLTALKKGESGILERIDMSDIDAQRLMELGFLPGHTVTRGHAAPGGDPRVFRVDGSEVALRRETAVHLILR